MKKNTFIKTTIVMMFCLFTIKTNAQQKNQTVEVPSIKKNILIGDFDKKGLELVGFKSEYTLTDKEKKVVKRISKKHAEKEVFFKVYAGTWCADTEKQLPLFLAFYDEVVMRKELQMIALDLQKTSPLSDEKTDDVKFVPTIIVYIDDKEVGRVVEKPKAGLLEDIEAILDAAVSK
jgi:thioredoxin 1